MLPRLLCDPRKEPCKQALLTPGLRRKCLYLCTPKRSKFEFVNLWSVLATSMLPQSILARGEGFHAIDKPVHPDHPQVLRSFQVRIVACRFVEEKSHYLPLPSVYQDTWSRGDLRQARNKISLYCLAFIITGSFNFNTRKTVIHIDYDGRLPHGVYKYHFFAICKCAKSRYLQARRHDCDATAGSVDFHSPRWSCLLCHEWKLFVPDLVH